MNTLLDFLLVIVRKRWVILAVTASCGLIGLGLGFAITPTYVAKARILVPAQASGLSAALSSLSSIGATLPGAAQLQAGKTSTEQWVGLLNSRIVVDQVVKKFNLKDYYEVPFLFRARETLMANTTIKSAKDGFIDIEVEDKDPILASKITNGFVDALQIASRKIAIGEAANRRKFLEEQLQQALSNLDKATRAMTAGNPGTDLIKIAPEALISLRVQAATKLAEHEAKIASMRASMTENNPRLVEAKAELDSLRSQMNALGQGDATIENQRSQPYIAAVRAYKYSEIIYESVARQYEIAKSDEAKEGAFIQVVDVAEVPEWKSYPSKKNFALAGIFGGFILGLIAAMLWYSKQYILNAKEYTEQIDAIKQAIRR